MGSSSRTTAVPTWAIGTARPSRLVEVIFMSSFGLNRLAPKVLATISTARMSSRTWVTRHPGQQKLDLLTCFAWSKTH
jgi:hypothetical protein